MMRAQALWNGTEAESYALLEAIARYCVCVYADTGALTVACQTHEALVHSQRFLDGLLFARRIARRLINEEFDLQGLANQPKQAPAREAHA
jgi:hypothetical protein